MGKTDRELVVSERGRLDSITQNRYTRTSWFLLELGSRVKVVDRTKSDVMPLFHSLIFLFFQEGEYTFIWQR